MDIALDINTSKDLIRWYNHPYIRTPFKEDILHKFINNNKMCAEYIHYSRLDNPLIDSADLTIDDIVH